MKKKEKKTYRLDGFRLPTYREIPSVGLYLDQTSKYINEALSELPECTITNSMISNYVKKKLIDNPVKKQYGRDQIAYLIFIAVTKSALSLDDVQGLFRLQKQRCSCEEAYSYFCERFDRLLNDEEKIREDDREKMLLENVIVTAVSNIRLRKLLEEAFEQ